MNAKESNAIIITGASRGIGAATARLAAAQGFSAAVNYKSGTFRSLGSSTQHPGARRKSSCDPGRRREGARHPASVCRGRARTRRHTRPGQQRSSHRRLCARGSRFLPALEHLFAVNVTGAILCAREAVKRMSTRHGGQGGAIVNISSLAARTGSPGEWVHYAASKGAIDTFTLGLAREVANEGIRVNAVAPGLVETGIHAANGEPGRLERLKSTIPMGRPGRPEEVAEAVVWLLSPATSYVTGSILEVGGGR